MRQAAELWQTWSRQSSTTSEPVSLRSTSAGVQTDLALPLFVVLYIVDSRFLFHTAVSHKIIWACSVKWAMALRLICEKVSPACKVYFVAREE